MNIESATHSLLLNNKITWHSNEFLSFLWSLALSFPSTLDKETEACCVLSLSFLLFLMPEWVRHDESRLRIILLCSHLSNWTQLYQSVRITRDYFVICIHAGFMVLLCSCIKFVLSMTPIIKSLFMRGRESCLRILSRKRSRISRWGFLSFSHPFIHSLIPSFAVC